MMRNAAAFRKVEENQGLAGLLGWEAGQGPGEWGGAGGPASAPTPSQSLGLRRSQPQFPPISAVW